MQHKKIEECIEAQLTQHVPTKRTAFPSRLRDVDKESSCRMVPAVAATHTPTCSNFWHIAEATGGGVVPHDLYLDLMAASKSRTSLAHDLQVSEKRSCAMYATQCISCSNLIPG